MTDRVDIAAVLDPEAFTKALVDAREVFSTRLAGLQVDYVLLEGDPGMEAEDKEAALAAQDKQRQAIAWRVEEIDRRLKETAAVSGQEGQQAE